MDLEKYKAQVGNFIKETRQAQKMSQKQLITDENGHQIISEKTLIEIEKGRKVPRPDTLSLLLSKLGKSILDVLVLFEGNEQLHFENRVWEIRSLLRENTLDKANLYYEQLEAEDWYDRKNPKVIQALLYLKGALYHELYREPDLALEALGKGLEQTRPLIFRSRAGSLKLDEAYIEATSLTKMEYLLLLNIGILYADTDELEDAVRICRIIITSITGGLVELEMRDYILSHVYYILSDSLLGLKRYQESLTISNQGIELFEKVQTAKHLGWLYFNKGIALYCLCDEATALSCFKQSQMMFEALGQQEYIDLSKNYAKENFGIEIG